MSTEKGALVPRDPDVGTMVVREPRGNREIVSAMLQQPAQGIMERTRHVIRRAFGRVQDIDQIREYLELFAEQHDEGMEIWKNLGLVSGDLEGMATKDEVLRWVWWVCTTNPQAIKRLENIGEVRLKLFPALRVARLIKILDSHELVPGQGMCNNEYPEVWSFAVPEEGEFGLTADVPNIPKSPFHNLENPQRSDGYTILGRNILGLHAAYRFDYERFGLSIMDQQYYLPSMMDFMARGGVYDPETFTIFDRCQNPKMHPDWYNPHRLSRPDSTGVNPPVPQACWRKFSPVLTYITPGDRMYTHCSNPSTLFNSTSEIFRYRPFLKGKIIRK